MDYDIAYNNLQQPGRPPLPEKRGSTLLRNNPHQATLMRAQPPIMAGDNAMWEPPLPPPRRDTAARVPSLPGSGMEAVPLRNGDLLLESGNETILVRGDVARPVNVS